jgi:hypothetical protein
MSRRRSALAIGLTMALGWLAATGEEARAQLGDTSAEIARRYGPVVRQSARIREHQILEDGVSDSAVHEKNGLYIRVVYGRGRVLQLEFSKKEGALTMQDVEALLDAAAGNSKWEPGRDSTDAIKFYHRADGRAAASWTTHFHGSLLINAEESATLLQQLLSN